jgi:hypothetical protein
MCAVAFAAVTYGNYLRHLPPARFQGAISAGLFLSNLPALTLFLLRARWFPLERRGWLLYAAAVPLVFLSNACLALAGLWQASFHDHLTIHLRTLAYAARLGITSGMAVNLLSQDPWRARGPLGWILAAMAILALNIAFLRPMLLSAWPPCAPSWRPMAVPWPWSAIPARAPPSIWPCRPWADLSHNFKQRHPIKYKSRLSSDVNVW